MNRKKERIDEYKQRTLRGGVYSITNTVNGRYLLCQTTDINAAQNRFEFLVSSNFCIDLKLQKEWLEFGGKAFVFKTLEELDKKPDQTRLEFLDDLKTLEELWREKLETGKGTSV